MKKSNREKHKAGIGNATEIAICDTLDERTLRSRQVQQKNSNAAEAGAQRRNLSKSVRVAYVTMHRED